MRSALMVFLAWGLFAGSHLFLGLPPRRDRLARHLGEATFVAIFSATAATSLALLAAAVATLGGEGLAGLALGRDPASRLLLGGLSFFGLTLAMAGLLNYRRSPMAVFKKSVAPPTGIERVTRHAFFVGLTMFATAHALLATTLSVAIYFAGFAALAGVGAVLQDRKLLLRHGSAYAEYMAATSIIPFVALIQRRQSLAAGEQHMRRVLTASALAFVLLVLHPLLSRYHGAPLAGLIAAGGFAAAATRWRTRKNSVRKSDGTAKAVPVVTPMP